MYGVVVTRDEADSIHAEKGLKRQLEASELCSSASGSHRRFSAGERHDRIGQRKDDQHFNFSGAPFRPLPAPQAGFAVGGVGALGQSEAQGRAKPTGDAAASGGGRQAAAGRCTWARPGRPLDGSG